MLGTELIAVWGMTENMIITTTRPGDPVELVSDSNGTTVDWMEIRVVDENSRPVAGLRPATWPGFDPTAEFVSSAEQRTWLFGAARTYRSPKSKTCFFGTLRSKR